ncbi:MAG: cytochrome-c peroxidase, partial [Pseudomonadota bacterium]|nr:cytochrome-c peroxidase [Pseudomonadota bacterium]
MSRASRPLAAAALIGALLPALAAAGGVRIERAAIRAERLLASGFNPHPVNLRLPPVRPLSALARLGRH